MFSWREHDEALDEYRHAARWYEDKREGWGDVFMDAVDAAVDSILDPAIGWGLYQSRKSDPQTYARSVAGFPCTIVYLKRDDEVYIVAYAHEKRRPGYWMPRLV